MQIITIHTLFDITNTDVVRNYKPILVDNHPTINTEQEWIKARQQQINFETLIQILSLRTQPNILHKPSVKNIVLKDFSRKGKGNIWTFDFSIEHDDVYADGLDKLGLLKKDCENVPMIIGLNEIITDEYMIVGKNIIFEIEQHDL